jgi:hypothetical protein
MNRSIQARSSRAKIVAVAVAEVDLAAGVVTEAVTAVDSVAEIAVVTEVATVATSAAVIVTPAVVQLPLLRRKRTKLRKPASAHAGKSRNG